MHRYWRRYRAGVHDIVLVYEWCTCRGSVPGSAASFFVESRFPWTLLTSPWLVFLFFLLYYTSDYESISACMTTYIIGVITWRSPHPSISQMPRNLLWYLGIIFLSLCTFQVMQGNASQRSMRRYGKKEELFQICIQVTQKQINLQRVAKLILKERHGLSWVPHCNKL